MSKLQALRALVNQSLTAAVETIFVEFQKTITEYENEICRLKEEKEHKHKRPDTVDPEVGRFHKAELQDFPFEAGVSSQVRPDRSPRSDPREPETPPLKDEPQEVVKRPAVDESPLHEVTLGDLLQRQEDIFRVPFIKDEPEDVAQWLQEPRVPRTQEEPFRERGGEAGGPTATPPERNENDAERQPSRYGTGAPAEQLDIRNLHWLGQRSQGQPRSRICPICNKDFSSRYKLTVHMRVHSGEKPYACKECGRRFSQSGALKAHMKLHSGERPFSCSFCGRSFVNKCNLTKHVQVHSAYKPFGCSVCGKRFNFKQALKVHTGLHGNQKPFSCAECGRGFCVKASLTVHMKRHAGEGRCPTYLRTETGPE